MENSPDLESLLSSMTEEEDFSSVIKLTPKMTSTTDEGYLRSILLSRTIRSLFCGTGFSRINLPKEGRSPFKPHIKIENVKIKTKSSEKIGGWLVSNENKSVKKWALVLHGNSTNRNSFSKRYNVEGMIEEGIGAFIIDYRGFGDSEGEPSKTAFMEDISAAIRHFKKMRIFSISIVGYSLGTAIALEYLAKYSKEKDHPIKIEKIVLISPFLSTIDLLREYRIWNWIESVLPESNESALVGMGYDSLKNAEKISIKSLVIHGAHDWLIPCHHGETLSKSIENSTFLKIENETHNSILKNPVTWKTIARFIEQ